MRTSAFMASLCSDDAGDMPGAAMIIAAHPDDETIGLASRLPRLRSAWFVHVTDGAPHDMTDALAAGCDTREQYAALRIGELSRAFALAGVEPERDIRLGFDDQRVCLQMAYLAERLARLIRERSPCAIITHPYEGGHPDHDATAFAVHAACDLLRARGHAPPAIIEMTSYHNGLTGITPATFLPAANCPVTTLHLTASQQALRLKLLDCFASQRETLQYFSREVECFRPAPRYDFTRPPHQGILFYDQFNWGVTSDRWRKLAQQALRSLPTGAAWV